jgi:ATP-binding cassette, subfamily B, bacterial
LEVFVVKREFTVAEEYHFRRTSATRWIISHMLRYRFFTVMWIIAAIGSWFLAAVIPVLTGLALNNVLDSHADHHQLITLTLIVLSAVLIQGGMDMVARQSSEILAQRTERDARDELYLNLLGKSQTFHNRQQVGDIMARASNDVRMLNMMISPGFDIIPAIARCTVVVCGGVHRHALAL